MASDIVATREREGGNQKSLSIPYFVRENDLTLSLALEDAIVAASTQATSDEGGAPGNYTYQRLGKNVVRVTAEFSSNETTPLPQPESGDLSYRFQFQARSKFLYLARDWIGAYDSAGLRNDADFPPHLQVNIQHVGGQSRVLGMQVDPLPETFSLDYTAPNAVVTGTYQNAVGGLCGAFNSTTFRGQDAATIQLVRVSGRKRTNEDWQLSFGFGYASVETSVDVGGGIVVPTVQPNWLMWTHDEERKNAALDVVERVPRFAVLQEAWGEADLNNLNLPA